MNELINVTLNENNEPIISARQLHKTLEVKTRFSQWVEQNFKMFKENEDFTSVVGTTLVNNGAVRELQDYAVTIRMAEHLAMMSKTNKGHEVREYFIQVEKDFNSPEKIMARALLMADKKVHKLEAQIEADRPKVLFADAVSASKSSCLIGELAKILKQNGIDIGRNKLFQWLRSNGYLISRRGDSWNQPTQKSMDLKLFELKKTNINHADGHTTTNTTTKVTGKGQQYFINKFLNQERLTSLDQKGQPMEITYKPVGVNETAEWGDYDHLMQRWEGLGKSMAKNLIREMRGNKDFQRYVFNPTHKLVFINYEGFKSFIEWKTRNRFK